MGNKISVIIPVYNTEKYLVECINSVLVQDFLHEIILINDGSKDNSSKICEEYRDKYPDIIKYKEINNHGASYARNLGIDLATGDYFIFIDSDDTITNNAFSRIISTLNKLNCDTIFWGLTKQYHNSGSVTYAPKSNYSNIKESTEDVILELKVNKENFYYFGFVCNKLYKRSIIEEYRIRFKDSLNIGEDEIFAMDYCNHIKSIAVLNDSFYKYRILNNSLTFTKKNILEYIMIAESLLANKENWISNELKCFDTIRAYQFALRGYFENSIISILTNKRLCSILLDMKIYSNNFLYIRYKASYTKRILNTKNKIIRFILLLISHFIVNIKNGKK